MRHFLPVALIPALFACVSDTTEGFADVQGTVVDASALPIANAAVTVSCGGRALSLAGPTDATGTFGVTLTAPAELMTGRSTQLSCSFTGTAAGYALTPLDTVLGFSSEHLPHARQFVHLTGVASP